MKYPVPTSVRVGVFIVPVIYQSQDDKGVFNSSPLPRISLLDLLEGTAMADAFLHEVLHAIWHIYALGVVIDAEDAFTTVEVNEEQMVGQFAQALTCFWKDNPLAHSWWKNLLEK